jgi:hypothetical protein
MLWVSKMSIKSHDAFLAEPQSQELKMNIYFLERLEGNARALCWTVEFLLTTCSDTTASSVVHASHGEL